MIQINKGRLSVEGTNEEILDDFRDLVLTICMRNNHKEIFEVEEIGKKTELIEDLFSLDSLLRMIYTCYSVSEEAFNELLRVNKKIVEEVKSGEMKLIFKKGEKDD